MPLINLNTKALKTGDPEPPAPKNGTLRIYNMRFCPWAQRTLIYAAAKNLPIEVINIHLIEKPEWYFNKHYKGQVPALEHDGRLIIESAVIPEYLDDIFPESRILPSDPYQKVQQKLLLERLSTIAPAFYGLVGVVKDPSVKEERYSNILKAFENAENLLTSEFYSGEKPGFVDYLIFPILQRVFLVSHVLNDLPIQTQSFPGSSKFPKLTEWYSKVSNLPEVIESGQPTEIALGFIKEYVKGNPQYDYGI